MNRIIGVESWKATWTPGAGVGRAGAAGDEGDARAAGHLAVGVGHVGDPAFLPADDGVDLGRVVQRVEHREEAFARHGEDAVAALDPELVDEDAAARADLERSHGLPPIGAARDAEAGIRIANQAPGLIHVSDSDPLEADDLARAKGCKSLEDNSNYYRRRASEEVAAAEGASSAAVAAVHRSLAERYLALAGEPQPAMARATDAGDQVVTVAGSEASAPAPSLRCR